MDNDTITTTSPATRLDTITSHRQSIVSRPSSKIAELQRLSEEGPTPEPRPAPFKEDSRLIVGRHIHLKGEITNCQVLTVEGQVEAAFSGRLLEVSDNGLFRGSATVETAEIHGRISGDLVATKLLRIHGGGKVSGKIRYKRLEVMPGGEIAGNVSVGEEATGGIALAEARSAGFSGSTT